MRSRTLVGRLFWLSALWAVFSIALIAFFISNGYRDNAEKRLAELLTANLYNLLGSVVRTDDGKLAGAPDLRDARFLTFRSGYYWSVTEIKNPANRLASASLVDSEINLPKEIPFDSDFQRQFEIIDEANNALLGIETQVFLGEGDNLYSFRITGNKSGVDEDVNAFIKQLLVLLTLFAIGFVLATYFLVRFGLAPLAVVSRSLSDIRAGKVDRLEGEFPLEIQPLVEETNSLIRSNNSVVERSRTQVGNLAHSLKTPLAVLNNEARNARPEIRKLIEEQVALMQAHVQSYLDRARIAANVGTITGRTAILPVVERLVRVMDKLNPDINFSINTEAGEKPIFAGERQDLEEIVGNLLENASKFAKNKVVIIIQKNSNTPNNFSILIEDDGGGMPKAQLKKALSRGVKLDESKPGSGLGLAIVEDIAGEYGGSISLARSELGGLKAILTLPCV